MRMQSTRLRAMSHVKVGAIEHVVRHVGDTSARACLCVAQRTYSRLWSTWWLRSVLEAAPENSNRRFSSAVLTPSFLLVSHNPAYLLRQFTHQFIDL